MNYRDEFLKVFEEYKKNIYSEVNRKELTIEVKEESTEYKTDLISNTEILINTSNDFYESYKDGFSKNCFFKSVEISKPGREEVQKELEKEADILAIY